MEKRKLSASKVCQYGTKCFRVNPSHFEDYCHPHLDEILKKGISTITNEIVIKQLSIVQNQSRDNQKIPSKVRKVKEENPGPDSLKIIGASSSSSTSKIETNSLADFFKERSRVFAAKLTEMQSSSSSVSSAFLTPARIERPNIRPELKRFFPLVLPKGQMAEKLRKAAPLNVFLTTVTSSIATHSDPSSVTFLELLDPSLGELESSVQFNFVVAIDWLLAQYRAANWDQLPLLIFYGQEDPSLSNISQMCPNVSSVMVNVPGMIGCHHAKVMLFFYKDKSMRIVISTANLYQEDWDNRVQGLWMSDRLPALSPNEESYGESATGFRADFIKSLEVYQNSQLQTYIERIKVSDFRSVNVFLVTSIPGKFKSDTYGHPRLGALLKKHSAPIDSSHPIIAQTSSLGNFGKSVSEYLANEVARSFGQHSGNSSPAGPSLQIIYPSLNNVKNSHDGLLGGGCLPYFRDAHKRQPWLNRHLFQWKSTSRNRDRAMPHIKSYCRHSQEGLFWFVLTSANMSKSAWGVYKGTSLNINSYEVGVAFFPRVILNGQDHFPTNEKQQKNNEAILKLPFDVPLVPYDASDEPFCIQDMQDYTAQLMAMQAM